jgi:hypothetical protein
MAYGNWYVRKDNKKYYCFYLLKNLPDKGGYFKYKLMYIL